MKRSSSPDDTLSTPPTIAPHLEAIRQAKPTWWWRQSATTSDLVVLLDYDGTLAPFVEQRLEAYPYEGVLPWVTRLARAPDTTVMIITGRSLDDLDLLFPFATTLEVWAEHGLARRAPDALWDRGDVAQREVFALDQAREAITSLHLPSRIEHKPFSVALHTRGLSPKEASDLMERALSLWSPLERAFEGLVDLHAFDGGVEMRLARATKASAARDVLRRFPDASIIYLGR